MRVVLSEVTEPENKGRVIRAVALCEVSQLRDCMSWTLWVASQVVLLSGFKKQSRTSL